MITEAITFFNPNTVTVDQFRNAPNSVHYKLARLWRDMIMSDLHQHTTFWCTICEKMNIQICIKPVKATYFYFPLDFLLETLKSQRIKRQCCFHSFSVVIHFQSIKRTILDVWIKRPLYLSQLMGRCSSDLRRPERRAQRMLPGIWWPTCRFCEENGAARTILHAVCGTGISRYVDKKMTGWIFFFFFPRWNFVTSLSVTSPSLKK